MRFSAERPVISRFQGIPYLSYSSGVDKLEVERSLQPLYVTAGENVCKWHRP